MSKLGMHIIHGWGGNLGKPPLVKLFNTDLVTVRDVRTRVGRTCPIIIRFECREYDLENNGAQEGMNWCRDHEAFMSSLDGDPYILYEGLNEVPDMLADGYCAFESTRLAYMHAHGRRCVVGCFSVGVPDFPVWEKYQPMLDRMQLGDVRRTSDWLGLHEYWLDKADIEDPGHWHCGRWKRVPQLANPDRPIPIVITECGRDYVEGKGRGGWRNCNISQDQFIDELYTYNRLLEGDKRVVGCTAFSGGDTRFGWDAYSVNELWPRIVANYGAAEAPATDPAPAPEPPQPKPKPVVKMPKCADFVLYQEYYRTLNWEARHGQEVLYLILHGTEGPRMAALAWFESPNNKDQSSAHDLIDFDGACYHLVPYELAAYHCGGSKLPGFTGNPNMPTIGVEIVCNKYPQAPGWTRAQLWAALLHCRWIVRTYKIRRERVLMHRTVDPEHRRDPRDFPFDWFVSQLYTEEPSMAGILETPLEKSLSERIQQYCIAQNPAAGFYQYGRARSWEPISGEARMSFEGKTYIVQAWYSPATRLQHVVYCEDGAWDKITHFDRPN